MKRIAILALTVLLTVSALAGCRSNVPQDTTGNIVPSTTTNPTTTTPTTTVPSGTQGGETAKAVELLQKVWEQHGKGFAAYGGSLENPVDGAPGVLDVADTEEMTIRCLIPQTQLASIEEAASLVHMMNSNIFTAVAVKIADSADAKAVREAWHKTIQDNNWICGQPDRLLMADVGDGYTVMMFGSADILKEFAGDLAAVYAQAKIVYDEAVVS